MTDMVVDLVPRKKTDLDMINSLLKEIQEMSKIVRLKREDFVIRSIIRGKGKLKILEELNFEFPDEHFTNKDLDEFIYMYRDIFVDEKKKLETQYGRQLMKQQEGLTNELIDLATATKTLMNKFQEDGDNTNTIAAVRTAADIFFKVGKIQGVFTEKPDVNVNMTMDKMVTNISANDSDFKSQILKIVRDGRDEENVVDAEYKE